MRLEAGGRTLSRVFGFAPLVIALAMLVMIGFRAPHFPTLATLEMILLHSLPQVLLSTGLAAVIMAGGDDAVSGGIDLSIPATAVLCAGIIARTLDIGCGLALSAALALIASMTVGALNAALVTKTGMTPLLATLAVSVAVVGGNDVITGSRRIELDHASLVLALRTREIAGMPLAILLGMALTALFFFLLHETRFGLNLQAAGGGRDAAEISGLRVRRLVTQSFLIAAFTGFLCGFFLLARGSGSSPGIEEKLMLEMVLATFLGTVFSPRHVVTMYGAALGAVLVAALSIGLQSMGVDVFRIGLMKGVLIVVIVAFSVLSRRAGRS